MPNADLLTKAEYRIAVLAARGCSNQEMAAQLYVSVNTVKTHLRRILQRVGARNKAHLVSMLMTEETFRVAVSSPVEALELGGRSDGVAHSVPQR